VGNQAFFAVVADAQDFGPGAHRALRGVVEDVALELARCFQAKACPAKLRAKGAQVVDHEFDLGLDGHRKQ
jgi:hypothetical protein